MHHDLLSASILCLSCLPGVLHIQYSTCLVCWEVLSCKAPWFKNPPHVLFARSALNSSNLPGHFNSCRPLHFDSTLDSSYVQGLLICRALVDEAFLNTSPLDKAALTSACLDRESHQGGADKLHETACGMSCAACSDCESLQGGACTLNRSAHSTILPASV